MKDYTAALTLLFSKCSIQTYFYNTFYSVASQKQLNTFYINQRLKKEDNREIDKIHTIQYILFVCPT